MVKLAHSGGLSVKIENKGSISIRISLHGMYLIDRTVDVYEFILRVFCSCVLTNLLGGFFPVIAVYIALLVVQRQRFPVAAAGDIILLTIDEQPFMLSVAFSIRADNGSFHRHYAIFWHHRHPSRRLRRFRQRQEVKGIRTWLECADHQLSVFGQVVQAYEKHNRGVEHGNAADADLCADPVLGALGFHDKGAAVPVKFIGTNIHLRKAGGDLQISVGALRKLLYHSGGDTDLDAGDILPDLGGDYKLVAAIPDQLIHKPVSVRSGNGAGGRILFYNGRGFRRGHGVAVLTLLGIRGDRRRVVVVIVGGWRGVLVKAHPAHSSLAVSSSRFKT